MLKVFKLSKQDMPLDCTTHTMVVRKQHVLIALKASMIKQRFTDVFMGEEAKLAAAFIPKFKLDSESAKLRMTKVLESRVSLLKQILQ